MFNKKIILVSLVISTSLLGADVSLASENDKPTLSQDSQPVMKSILDAYMQKTGFENVQNNRLNTAQTLAEYSNSWRASDVDVTLHHETDRFHDNNDMTNWQLGAGVALRLPSQRKAYENLSSITLEQYKQAPRLAYWEASANLRKLVWDLKQAKSDYQISQQSLSQYQDLSNQIAKQVEVGERPKLDLMMAEQKVLQAKAALELSMASHENALKAYQRWTGFSDLPVDMNESMVTELHSQHPKILQIQQSIELSKAELESVRAEKSGNPSVFVGLQQDKVQNQQDGSVIFEVSFPLGINPNSNKQLAEKKLAMSQTVYELNQQKIAIELALQQTKQQVQSLQQSLQLNKQNLDIAEQTYRLSEKAYRLGEMELQNLLLSQQQKLQSYKEYMQTEIDLARTKAEYNQLAGYILGEKQ